MLSLPLMLTACAAPAEIAPGPPVGSSSPGSLQESADSPSDAPVDTSGAEAGTASLVMAGESFSFVLAFCAIDERDILVHGPGQGDESGEPAYLDVDFVREMSFTAGGARIDLGATRHLQSMDDFSAFDTEYSTGEYSLTLDGASFALEGEFRSARGESLGPGTLTVECR